MAIWFGCGLVPRAPGTAGTLGALPLYWLLSQAGPLGLWLGSLALLPVAIWSAGVVVEQLGQADPQRIVIDEVVGLLVACSPIPTSWSEVAFAVVAFRALDVLKPFPARRAERLPGGYGVVVDDVVAGLWAAAGLVLARSLGVLT